MTLRLVTHDGSFHADDVLAYAVLQAVFPDHTLYRTRQPAFIEQAHIVFDVGMVFDTAAHRFDHHMSAPPLRANGTPFSSAGLVWQAFGRVFLALTLDATLVEEVFAHLDTALFADIDRADNGIPGPTPALVSLVAPMNAAWDEAQDTDAAFQDAAALVHGHVQRLVVQESARIRARGIVADALALRTDPRVLELSQDLPWGEMVHDTEVLFVVSSKGGNWHLSCVPIAPRSFTSRRPLKAAWAGLSGMDLQQASGIPDAEFVHRNLFFGVARSRGGVMKMIEATLAC